MTVETNTTTRTEYFVRVTVTENTTTARSGTAGTTFDSDPLPSQREAEQYAAPYSFVGHDTTVVRRTITEAPVTDGPCGYATPTGPCDRSAGHPGDHVSADDAPRAVAP